MSQNQVSTDILIVGGGFAGLAAALRLHRAGARIRILEKRPFFGGRAYSFTEAHSGQVVDNGQHLMMGAYHETFQFLKDLGTLELLHFQDNLEVSFAEPGKFTTLKCPSFPAPFHLALGLLRFKGLKFRDKRAMVRLMRFCKKARGQGAAWDEISVTQLFARTGQTPDAVRKFWEPLGLAVLNESMDQASAALFLEVLSRGLLKKKRDSNLVIPTVGFSELYAQPAQELFEDAGVPLHFQTQVARIERAESRWQVHTTQQESFVADRVLLAVPPNALHKILRASDLNLNGIRKGLERFQSAPIISINLWYENFHPPASFVGLIDSPIHWVFSKSRILSHKKADYLSLVVSGAYHLAGENKETLIHLAEKELQRFFPELAGLRPSHNQIVKEHEATFSGRMGLQAHRPHPRTGEPGLYLAGDWIDTGLPATIESAVASGHEAARCIQESA